MSGVQFFIWTSLVITFYWRNWIQNFLIRNFVKVLLNYQLIGWNILSLLKLTILFTMKFLFIEHCYFIFFINSILSYTIIQYLTGLFVESFWMSIISEFVCISRNSFCPWFDLYNWASLITLSCQYVIWTGISVQLRISLTHLFLVEVFSKNRGIFSLNVLKRFGWNFLLILCQRHFGLFGFNSFKLLSCEIWLFILISRFHYIIKVLFTSGSIQTNWWWSSSLLFELRRTIVLPLTTKSIDLFFNYFGLKQSSSVKWAQ